MARIMPDDSLLIDSRPTREAALAYQIVKAMHDSNLCVQKSPWLKLVNCIELAIVTERLRYGDKTGEPVYEC